MLIFDNTSSNIDSTLINRDGVSAHFGSKDSSHSESHNRTFWCKQVHKDRIVEITETSEQRPEEADGLITQTDSCELKIITADCVPLVYADHKKGTIGITHNGWQGTFRNISEKMIQQFTSRGSDLTDIAVAIGPSIGPCCYRIYGERLELFRTTYPDLIEKVLVKYISHTGLNLVLLNYQLLLRAGISNKNIDYGLFCTSCDESRFYSYNRSKENQRMENFVVRYAYSR